MASKDMDNNQKATQALDSLAISTETTTTGDIIDTQGYEGVEFTLQSATVADGTFTMGVNQGDDPALSDTSAASGDEILGSGVISASNSVAQLGYVGDKRYVQLSVLTDADSDGTVSGTAALGHPLHAPVS